MSQYTDKAKALVWRESSMLDAILHAQNRQPLNPETPSVSMKLDDYCEAGVVLFSDNTGIACVSEWTGPYSRLTPDIDGEPPKWFIGETK